MAENKIAAALELLGLSVDEEFEVRLLTGDTKRLRVSKGGIVAMLDDDTGNWSRSWGLCCCKS